MGKKRNRVLAAFPIAFRGVEEGMSDLSRLLPKAKLHDTGKVWHEIGGQWDTWGSVCAERFESLWCAVQRSESSVGSGTLGLVTAFGEAGKAVHVFQGRWHRKVLSIDQLSPSRWRLLPYHFGDGLGNLLPVSDLPLDAMSLGYDPEAPEGSEWGDDGVDLTVGKGPTITDFRAALREFDVGHLWVRGGWPFSVEQVVKWHAYKHDGLRIYYDVPRP